jgi:hypothetical protein
MEGFFRFFGIYRMNGPVFTHTKKRISDFFPASGPVFINFTDVFLNYFPEISLMKKNQDIYRQQNRFSISR